MSIPGEIMNTTTTTPSAAAQGDTWLKPYYFARAAFNIAWVAAAVTIGKNAPAVAAALLVAYPLWDAAANFVDAQRNGGLKQNPSQMLNMVVSVVTAAAVAIALGKGMNAVLGVFGVWATLSGLGQLATGVRRWKRHGAQWPMILSGGQSAIVGAVFLKQASAAAVPGIVDIAPYAGFGAFYFLIAAISLAVADARRGKATLAKG
jgi:uncharacterized membrane protein HdeD (DUF308 family)